METKKYSSLLLILLAATVLWGQAPETAAAAPASEQTLLLGNSMTIILVIIGAALFATAMFYMIRVNQLLYKHALKLEARLNGVNLPDDAIVPEAGTENEFWTRLRKKYWEDAVPMEREGEILSHHDFDGIRELDNRLPPWWVNMFLITIVYAVGYMFWFHWGGSGPSSAEEYEMEVQEAKKLQAAVLANAANAIDESNVTAVADVAAIGEGELIFKNVCAACHGQKGEGTVGPNLTDEHWIHGGGIKNVFKTIKYGVPEKGMIAWQSQLKPSDMQKVASYILTLKGTNPPNPKAPQGEIWKEEAPAAETSGTPADPAQPGGGASK